VIGSHPETSLSAAGVEVVGVEVWASAGDVPASDDAISSKQKTSPQHTRHIMLLISSNIYRNNYDKKQKNRSISFSNTIT
jgi:hypothetical protein